MAELLIPTEESCSAFNIKRKPTQPREILFLNGEQYSQNPWFKSFSSQQPEENNINEITLSFKQNLPYELETEQDGDLIKSKYKAPGNQSDEPFIKVKIIPNFDHENGLEIRHNHKWDTATDMFTGIMTKAIGMAADLQNFIHRMEQMGDNTAGVGQRIRHDVAEQYVSTEKQRITIPFSLFTKDDFVRDILTPLMVLTSLSYPKRVEDKDSEVGSALEAGAGLIRGGLESVAQAAGSGTQGGDASDDGTQNLNKLVPGFRVFTIENPPLVDVHHSGKLFIYNNCYISNITYNFLGPWINASGQDPQAVEAFKNNFQQMNGWKNAVPTKAECSIELATREPHFADDYLSILKEARQGKNGGGNSDGLVNVLTNRGQ